MKANHRPDTLKRLDRKWARLVEANRFDEAQDVAREMDAVFAATLASPQFPRFEADSQRCERDARAACEADWCLSEVVHDPRG